MRDCLISSNQGSSDILAHLHNINYLALWVLLIHHTHNSELPFCWQLRTIFSCALGEPFYCVKKLYNIERQAVNCKNRDCVFVNKRKKRKSPRYLRQIGEVTLKYRHLTIRKYYNRWWIMWRQKQKTSGKQLRNSDI